MHLSFIYPAALWLLLLLPLLWAFALATRAVGMAHLGPGRFWILLALRSAALLALVLALAGTQLVRPVDTLTVVFLIDGSDSVSPALRAQAVGYVDAALSSRRPGDRAAVVFFGQNALVERAPAAIERLGQLSSTVVGSRTNIEDAIQLGLALFPADTQKRLVLLSDGRENQGRAADALRFATARGIPLDVVPLSGGAGPDVLVSALDSPDAAREGQEITLQARVESSIATSGRLQVFAGGELVGAQEVAIQPGVTMVPVTVAGGEAGFYRYEVRLEAAGDTQPLNNRAAAFTTVQGPPRVLLVASDPARAAPLQSALAAANVRADLVSPGQIPAQQAGLRAYAAVVLVDVLARDVPRAAQEALPVYVREQGGSLAMVGGRESFGAGGWRRSPVAAALPVDLDPQDRQERPDLALALVIDRSGSMAESVGGSLTKLDLAKEAVYQASLGLERNDQLGVVVFDSTGEWVLPMQQLPSIVAIEQSLSTVSDGGGTNIRAGIEPAAESLAGVDARVKHMILLTDGIADSNYADLIRQMRDNRVTITVVSIGADANPALEQIAELGGGRYYRVRAIGDVPRIFLAETVTVAGRDIVEEPFTPAVALSTPLTRGLGGLPQLYGYNATEPRPTARTILVSPDGKPVLAQWQYGLGRALAWTSDLKGQWARDWISWDAFPRFAGGMVDALLPPQQIEGLALETRAENGMAILEVVVEDAGGRPLSGAAVEGRLLDPGDRSAPVRFTQVGAGRYRAVVPTDAPGVYLAQVAVLDAQGQAVGSASAGLVVAYSPEYSDVGGGANLLLLEELAGRAGGRSAPAPETVFTPVSQPVGVVQEVAIPLLWLALLLLPLDVALRRLMLRRSDFAPLARLLRRPASAAATPAASPSMARLQAARARARRARTNPSPGSGGSSGQTDGRRTAASQQEASQQPAELPPSPAPAATSPEDRLASLLAAKQRARRKDGGR